LKNSARVFARQNLAFGKPDKLKEPPQKTLGSFGKYILLPGRSQCKFLEREYQLKNF